MADRELKRIGRLSLVNATVDHAEQIADHLRLPDRIECMIHGVHPLEALTEPLVVEGARNYSLKVDDDCIAMCGVVPIDEMGYSGRAWFLGTGGVNVHFRTFIRGCKDVVDLLQGEYEQIENVVPATSHDTIMWLSWCGFMFEEETYFVNNQAMIRFVRCKNPKNNVYYLDKRPVVH